MARFGRSFPIHPWFTRARLPSIILTTLTSAGVASASFTGASTNPGTFTSAGAATISDVGVGITATTFTSAGAAADALIARLLYPSTLSSAGTGALTAVGALIKSGTMSVSGTATAHFLMDYNPVVSTFMIQKPVDYVMAGEPDKYKDGQVPFALLKKIFGD